MQIPRFSGSLLDAIQHNMQQMHDDRKNQPLMGLEIIRGSQAAPHNGKWEQGRILDPDDGAEYKLVMELKNGSQVLLVRGYWSVFWRTQQWHRQGP
jgi:uncharacterized protein (DUF2147 family)